MTLEHANLLSPSLIDLFDNLDDVFVGELVVEADALWIVLNGLTPHKGALELPNDAFVNGVAEICDSRL